MQGDGRSRRIVIVPDSVVNPQPGATDHLSRLADDGWGVMALCPADMVPAARDAWTDAIVEQVVTFIGDGYVVMLADVDDPEVDRFAEVLRATGREPTGRLELPR